MILTLDLTVKFRWGGITFGTVHQAIKKPLPPMLIPVAGAIATLLQYNDRGVTLVTTVGAA